MFLNNNMRIYTHQCCQNGRWCLSPEALGNKMASHQIHNQTNNSIILIRNLIMLENRVYVSESLLCRKLGVGKIGNNGWVANSVSQNAKKKDGSQNNKQDHKITPHTASAAEPSLFWPNNCTADAPQVEIYKLLHISHTSFNLTNVRCPEAEIFFPALMCSSAVYNYKHTACHFLVAILENVSQRHFVLHRHD